MQHTTKTYSMLTERKLDKKNLSLGISQIEETNYGNKEGEFQPLN